MDENQKSKLKKKIVVIGGGVASELAKNLHGLAKEAGVATGKTKELVKEINLAQGLSAKGKTLNPNYKKPIIRRAYKYAPYKMHGTLNKPIRVRVKTKDGAGFEQKLEKVKIALKKGLIKTA